ncbi:hypothetical protein H4696_000242 [Amycolatopsis lexingtonensis]|uniref:CAAX prenyl protease 2/Lysostaphin resistance protein A-like domain-containing protein n=1 Tax=Amycolatopsis lexingtonensis TaxID=218822 RepID=A0ABR9HQE6_9PSEU|nr:CPBP family intramembrane glutamic endopeptidase [Amycolatopsis lexingtonensis]MBE1493142.1 hypothetical protein [Amycolatopsis lexingtonensis]
MTRIPSPDGLPIPADTRVLLLATVVVLGSAGVTLAAHVHTRWPALRRFPMLGLHCTAGSVVVLGGLALTGPSILAPAGLSWWRLALGAVLGPGLGLLIVPVDRRITAWWGVRSEHTVRERRSLELRSAKARPAGIAAGSAAARTRRTGLIEARNDFAPTASDLRVQLWLLVAVAVVEELMFRGVLVALGRQATGTFLVVLCVLGAQLAFAVSHVFFGWGQVLAKLPLAALTTIAVLATGTVLPAVVAHVLFNVSVWRYHRATPRVTPAGQGRWAA